MNLLSKAVGPNGYRPGGAAVAQQQQQYPQSQHHSHNDHPSHRRTSSTAGQAAPGPPGTYNPGTILSVNGTNVLVERFLAQGGFAHVYVVSATGSNGESQTAVLKRVACPDADALKDAEHEISFMRQLKGHKNIVTYLDSSVQKLRTGIYEVFILMEHCRGGHLVDFLNTRLTTRLSEPEVLHIFSDICEGVAHMHYLSPPIIHRDIKVENVLIADNNVHKLCDFGSATIRRIEPGTSMGAQEIRLLEEEVGKYTTLQYRSPELCDLYQKKGMTEKMDMWALGVLLYKLCFFTTPFEDSGALAILNVRYTMPTHPAYSRNLLAIIESMLVADVHARANIYQVFSAVCRLRGVPCLLPNIYPTPSPIPVPTPAPAPIVPTPNFPQQQPPFSQDPSQINITTNLLPDPTTAAIPSPMRRGRPPKHSKTSSTASAGSFDTSQLPDAVHSPHNPFTTTTTASRPGSGGSGGFSNTPNNRFTAPPGFFKEAEVGFGGQGGNRLTAPPAFLDAAAGVVAGFAGGEGVDGRRQSGVPSSSSEASLVDVGGAGGFGQTAGFGSFSTFPAQFDPVASSSPGLVPQQQQFTQQQQPPSPFDPFDPFAPQPHPQIRRDSHRSIADLKLALSSGLPPPQPHSLQPHPINTQPQPQTQSHPFTKSTSEMRLNNIDAGPRLHGHSRNKSWAQPRSPVGINTTNITPGMGTAPYFTPVGRHPHSHSVEHSRHASRDSFESSVSSLGAGAGAGGVMMMQGQEATTSPHVADLVRHFQQSASLIDDSSPMSAAGLRKHSVSGMMFPPGGFSQQQQQQQLQPPLKPPRPLGLPLNSPLAPAPVPLPSPMTPLPPTAYPSAHDPFFPASANWMAAQGMQGGDANVFGTSAGMSPLVPLQQRQGGVGQQGLGQHQQQASSRSVLDSKGDDFLRGLMER